MNTAPSKTEWEVYCEREIGTIREILTVRGYTIDDDQPHIKGERFLMSAVTTTSGIKLILLGAHADGRRVVIKASKERNGIREIEHERVCRTLLTSIDFARDTFRTPEEIAHIHIGAYVINIQAYIHQSTTFLERPIEEQCMFALSAFKGQEGAHATTYKHRKIIKHTFGIRSASTYQKNFAEFKKNCISAIPSEIPIASTLSEASEMLDRSYQTIKQYTSFLTHTDFVPHNFRIQNNIMYLLDHSSLTFGNKYEGWARFINFMTLYNPPLADALEHYVYDNRTAEEFASLRCMRVYRLGELMWYYVRTLNKSTGNLLLLNTERIAFWHTILTHTLNQTPVPQSVIDTYRAKRDALRSEDERARQKNLH